MFGYVNKTVNYFHFCHQLQNKLEHKLEMSSTQLSVSTPVMVDLQNLLMCRFCIGDKMVFSLSLDKSAQDSVLLTLCSFVCGSS